MFMLFIAHGKLQAFYLKVGIPKKSRFLLKVVTLSRESVREKTRVKFPNLFSPWKSTRIDYKNLKNGS